MLSAVKNAKHDDGVRTANKENPIRKPPNQHATDFGFTAEAREAKRVLGGPFKRGFNLIQEFAAQAGLLLLVPDRRVGNVRFSLVPDNDLKWLAHQGRSLAWIRALTSSQELPAFGDFSYSEIAASSAFLSVAESSPRSCHASPANSSSRACTSASSSELRCDNSAIISALLMPLHYIPTRAMAGHRNHR